MALSKKIIGVLICALFLYLALKGVTKEQIAHIMSNINLFYIVCGLVCVLGSYIIRAYLWKLILSTYKDVKLVEAVQAVFIGNMANCIFPARLGDLLRIYVMKKTVDINALFSTGGLIIERILDLLCLGLIIILLLFILPQNLSIWGNLKSILNNYGIIFALLFLLLAIVLWKAIKNEKVRTIFGKQRFYKAFVELLEKVRENAHKLFLLKTQAIKLLFIAALIWIGMFFYIAFVIKACTINVPYYVPLLILVFINLSFLLPAVPGNIGIYQFICVFILSYFGIKKDAAFIFSIVLQLIDFLPSILLGLFFASQLKIKIATIKPAFKEGVI